jgi:hypothetical protein
MKKLSQEGHAMGIVGKVAAGKAVKGRRDDKKEKKAEEKK